jgi:GT2 family glycosyltransferase
VSVDLTIAICTWNRAALLRGALRSLTRLTIPEGVRWDVLVVDNASPDDTPRAIEELRATLPLRSVVEPNVGLSHARNRVLAEVRSDWILWTDDDVEVKPDWLAAAVEAIRANPDAAVIGGPIEPLFPEAPDPVVLEAFPELRKGFCGLDYGGGMRALRPGEDVTGANMLVRRKWLDGMSFDPRLGVAGATYRVGEEVDVQRRIRERGGAVVWAPAMRVKHHVDPKRMRVAYLLDWQVGVGETLVRMEGAPPGRRLFGVPLWLVRGCVDSLLTAGLDWTRRRRAGYLAALRRYHRYRGMIRGARQLAQARG